jgi:ABC-2 type transport system ATP-binding protein
MVYLDYDSPAVSVIDLQKAFRVRSKDGVRSPGLKGWVQGSMKSIPAVEGVSFEVPRREIFGILGPNGSGKSTLIRILSTLVLQDSGDCRIFGLDVNRDSMELRRHINRVSVDAAFFKKLSAWENLSYAARLYGIPVSDARKQVTEILEELGFGQDRIDEPLEEMSRGMQQKVAIARALFTSPVLLLMDEPTTGLDPVSKRQVQDYTLDVRDRNDATVLLTTHDMDEAQRVCDRIAIIHHGRFIAVGTVPELKTQAGCEDGSLEDVFFEMTGKDLAHADLETEEEGSSR